MVMLNALLARTTPIRDSAGFLAAGRRPRLGEDLPVADRLVAVLVAPFAHHIPARTAPPSRPERSSRHPKAASRSNAKAQAADRNVAGALPALVLLGHDADPPFGTASEWVSAR